MSIPSLPSIPVLASVSLVYFSVSPGSAFGEAPHPGTFKSRQMISDYVVGTRGLAVADLDGDGYADVLATSEYEGNVYWFRNEGGHGFEDGIVLTDTFASALTVNAADVSRDGRIDVIVGGDQRLEWYENLGDGKFASGRSLSDDMPKIIRVSVADLDQDGDLDVISASKWKVAWFENLGSGSFGPPVVLNSDVKHVNWVETAALNGDERPDVFAVSYEYEFPEIDEDPSLPRRAEGSDSLFWHANLGGGQFGPAQLVLGEPGIIQSHAASGDFDGDGRQDLISCLFYLDQIVWFRNLPGGSFSEPRVITNNVDAPEALLVEDVDLDGDMDVISASLFDGMFMLYPNVGDGTFGDPVVLASGVVGAIALEGADVDHDGDVDVIGAAEGEGSVFWFENTARIRRE